MPVKHGRRAGPLGRRSLRQLASLAAPCAVYHITSVPPCTAIPIRVGDSTLILCFFLHGACAAPVSAWGTHCS